MAFTDKCHFCKNMRYDRGVKSADSAARRSISHGRCVQVPLKMTDTCGKFEDGGNWLVSFHRELENSQDYRARQ